LLGLKVFLLKSDVNIHVAKRLRDICILMRILSEPEIARRSSPELDSEIEKNQKTCWIREKSIIKERKASGDLGFELYADYFCTVTQVLLKKPMLLA